MHPRLLVCVILLLAGCATSDALVEKEPVEKDKAQVQTKAQAQTKAQTKAAGMVVTANPHATEAGLAILRAGGTAVDAAVAIEAVLSLVEPQSSGMAGGGFMVHFDAETNTLAVYDGRETAPVGVEPGLFLKPSGEPLGFLEAKISGLSTGVPGMVAMLAMAHREQGALKWHTLFDSATNLATNGFEISPRLYGFIEYFAKYVPDTIEEGPLDTYEYFYDSSGTPLPVGHILKNPDYAETLGIISAAPSEFYTGSIAREIVDMVGRPPRAGGMTMEDVASYLPKKREALCFTYHEKQICGAPPPSSWVAVAMTLGILERGPGFSDEGVNDFHNWALFAEAQRLAYADRDQYVADSDFVQVPLKGLMNNEYLASRSALVSSELAIPKIAPGDPWMYEPDPSHEDLGRDATFNAPGTSHFVVVDAAGDVVSMTATVESVFGSMRMVGGMFLNNQLTDFSFKPVDDEGRPVANAVAPGKRPRSSMSPTIVLDEKGAFLMATGSPGGNNIIAYTAKSLIGVLDWGLSAQQSVALPNMVARRDVVRVENDTNSEELVNYLRAFGFEVDDTRGENSGLSVVIRRKEGHLEGGVDPRREGVIGID